jgi:cell division septation protein DedD
MEKPYFEIKVTFVHIVVLLIAVVLIGILLFYMGYQAGHRTEKEATSGKTAPILTGTESKEEELKIVDEKPLRPPGINAGTNQSISDEMKLHQQKTQNEKSIEPKPAARTQSYYVIQVGAFFSFGNAKVYSEKFRTKGYQTEIITPDPQSTNKLFRVRVGHFSNLEDAKKEKEKLEKTEKKKFSIANSR